MILSLGNEHYAQESCCPVGDESGMSCVQPSEWARKKNLTLEKLLIRGHVPKMMTVLFRHTMHSLFLMKTTLKSLRYAFRFEESLFADAFKLFLAILALQPANTTLKTLTYYHSHEGSFDDDEVLKIPDSHEKLWARSILCSVLIVRMSQQVKAILRLNKGLSVSDRRWIFHLKRGRRIEYR
jgi:hypothetical protein